MIDNLKSRICGNNKRSHDIFMIYDDHDVITDDTFMNEAHPLRKELNKMMKT